MEPQKTSRILSWALVLGIVIVLNLFFNYAVQLVYDEPRWENFCPPDNGTIPVTATQCEARDGIWRNDVTPRPPVDANITPPKTVTMSWCDLTSKCNQEFNDIDRVYRRNVFIILVAAGLVSLIIGLLAAAGAVSLGLSFGGVLSLIIAAIRFWSNMDDYLRVIILGVALVLLIWLGLKKFRQ